MTTDVTTNFAASVQTLKKTIGDAVDQAIATFEKNTGVLPARIDVILIDASSYDKPQVVTSVHVRFNL